ncbi:colicin E5-related ribonuclease, partial [Escherichia coli]
MPADGDFLHPDVVLPGLKIDQKIRGQMPERGWTEDDIKNTVSNGATGTSFDKRSPKK